MVYSACCEHKPAERFDRVGKCKHLTIVFGLCFGTTMNHMGMVIQRYPKKVCKKHSFNFDSKADKHLPN